MDIVKIQQLLLRYDPKGPIEHSAAELIGFESMLQHPPANEYLSHCLTAEGFNASGVNFGNLDRLRGENLSGGGPGCYIFPYQLMIFATSIGGNAVCLDGKTGGVVWVDQASFADELILLQDRETGAWQELNSYNDENVRRATFSLSDSMEAFLIAALSNVLEETLERLDH